MAKKHKTRAPEKRNSKKQKHKTVKSKEKKNARVRSGRQKIAPECVVKKKWNNVVKEMDICREKVKSNRRRKKRETAGFFNREIKTKKKKQRRMTALRYPSSLALGRRQQTHPRRIGNCRGDHLLHHDPAIRQLRAVLLLSVVVVVGTASGGSRAPGPLGGRARVRARRAWRQSAASPPNADTGIGRGGGVVAAVTVRTR